MRMKCAWSPASCSRCNARSSGGVRSAILGQQPPGSHSLAHRSRKSFRHITRRKSPGAAQGAFGRPCGQLRVPLAVPDWCFSVRRRPWHRTCCYAASPPAAMEPEPDHHDDNQPEEQNRPACPHHLSPGCAYRCFRGPVGAFKTVQPCPVEPDHKRDHDAYHSCARCHGPSVHHRGGYD